MPFLGIEIGGTKLQLVLGDKSGEISAPRRLAVKKEKGAEGIRRQIEVALPDLIRGKKIEAVGVGFGGPVNWKSGKICRSHQIEGWSEFDLAGWLQKLTGRRVRVDNDANVAALGEALRGAGKGFDPVSYVTLGSGVGGGLVTRGKIYHGAMPGEAEIGHVRLDRTGTTLESRCSGWAVDARARDAIKKEPKSVLAKIARKPPGGGTAKGEARFLAEAVEVGDASAQKILEDVAEDLAFGFSHVVHLFHPEVIILGGGLSKVGEALRIRVEKRLTGFVMEAFRPGPPVKLAKLGEDAVPVGALMLAGM